MYQKPSEAAHVDLGGSNLHSAMKFSASVANLPLRVVWRIKRGGIEPHMLFGGKVGYQCNK